MVHPGVINRFIDRFVGVLVFGVLADDGDADFVSRVAESVQQVGPGRDVQGAAGQAQFFDDEFIQLVVDQ